MEADGKQNLDGILECAIVVSWPDFTRGAKIGLVHFVPKCCREPQQAVMDAATAWSLKGTKEYQL
jgi:hypothetical protein